MGNTRDFNELELEEMNANEKELYLIEHNNDRGLIDDIIWNQHFEEEDIHLCRTALKLAANNKMYLAYCGMERPAFDTIIEGEGCGDFYNGWEVPHEIRMEFLDNIFSYYSKDNISDRPHILKALRTMAYKNNGNNEINEKVDQLYEELYCEKYIKENKKLKAQIKEYEAEIKSLKAEIAPNEQAHEQAHSKAGMDI